MYHLWADEYTKRKEITLSLSDANFMWEYMQEVSNRVGIENTLLLTIPKLTEVYLRSRVGRGELLFEALPVKYLELEHVNSD